MGSKGGDKLPIFFLGGFGGGERGTVQVLRSVPAFTHRERMEWWKTWTVQVSECTRGRPELGGFSVSRLWGCYTGHIGIVAISNATAEMLRAKRSRVDAHWGCSRSVSRYPLETVV